MADAVGQGRRYDSTNQPADVHDRQDVRRKAVLAGSNAISLISHKVDNIEKWDIETCRKVSLRVLWDVVRSIPNAIEALPMTSNKYLLSLKQRV